MSGYKKVTVSISESEYHRLVEAENKLRFQQSNRAAQSANSSQAIDQAVTQVWNQLQEMEKRQSQFLNTLDDVSPQIKEIEQRTTQTILDQAVEFANDLNAFKDEFIESAQDLVAEQSEYFTQAILQEHAQQQQALMRLQRKASRAQQSAEQKRELAAEWIATSDQISHFILNNYRHELHAPGRLASIQPEIELAEQNLQNEILDGAILGAQQAYLRLSQLRLELEKSEQEWHTLHHSVLLALQGLLHQIENSREFPAIDLDGNELPEMIPVDIWSSGRLSALATETRRILEALDQPDCEVSLADLKKIQTTDIPERINSLVKIIHDARKAVISSQMRINIAEIVVHALENQGFALEEGDYEDAEMRNSFNARLVSLDGSEVFIKVVPSQQDAGTNDLYLNNSDAEERTDYELKRRAVEITNTLGQYGLQVKNLHILSEPQTGDAARSDAPMREDINLIDHRMHR